MVARDAIAQLIAAAVDAAEGAAALAAVGDMERRSITVPLVNVEQDDVDAIFDEAIAQGCVTQEHANAFGSPKRTLHETRVANTPPIVQPELVSAAARAAAALIVAGFDPGLACAPGTPVASTPNGDSLIESTPPTVGGVTPPTPPPPPPLPPVKKKTKDQVVRDERLALAAKALLVPDPSPRPQETHDLINWRAVMESPVQDVVECIKCRGMHFMLAARIQRVLRRVQRERNGVLSLEFLRNVPTDEARGYLLSMEGYGVKTVSCILLLALYRADFPVDVNVGRIMARLGWVPLETEESLEELSQYAPEPAVYTFLRERLNSFGLQTLFELHYHMITLGKVRITFTEFLRLFAHTRLTLSFLYLRCFARKEPLTAARVRCVICASTPARGGSTWSARTGYRRPRLSRREPRRRRCRRRLIRWAQTELLKKRLLLPLTHQPPPVPVPVLTSSPCSPRASVGTKTVALPAALPPCCSWIPARAGMKPRPRTESYQD